MLTPNTILQNRYRIIRQLGQGGMGTVYEAIDQRFDSQVAIKETHFNDEVLRKQFEREARLLNRLRHPAMTRVIDHFSENDGQFLVMDFVAGEELWEMLQKQGGAFPVDKVLSWADQLLDALDYLHKQDPPIIHRDIKPQNLKLSNTGQIILLDFGLAKGFTGQISRVTTSGSIFGYTPNYAPLEQIQGTGTDARSDLYSLATTLYHLITGVVPPDALSRATANVSDQPDPLRSASEINPRVPVEVAKVFQQAMAQNPNKRFASAAEMREALCRADSLSPNVKAQAATVLPPTVVETFSTTKKEQVEILQPTTVDIVPAENIKEPHPTVAAATIASPTASSPKPAQQPALSSGSWSPQLSAFAEQPVKKSSRWLWIFGSVATLIIISVIVAVINYTSNTSNSSSKSTNPALSQLLPERIRKSGELRIGTDATFPPFESPASGQFEGFDIDLGNAIARELGVRARFINTGFDGIFPALQQGTFDVVMSGVTITPERSASMLFSDPYYDSGQMIAVGEGTQGISTPDDLRGKRVGVQINTTAQYDLEKRAGVKVAKYNTLGLALLDLKNNRIDAVVADAPILIYMILQSFPELKTVGQRYTEERFGIAVARGNGDLVRAINAALKQIKDSGEYRQLNEKWFGSAN